MRNFKKIYRYFSDKLAAFQRFMDKYISSPKAVVLVYHRVANLTSDPLSLAVSQENFDDQLRKLLKEYKIISVDELVKRIQVKNLEGNELSITFDDGYKDNITNALPIAKKYNIPMIIFLTTGIFDTLFSFPWDPLYGNNKDVYLKKEEIKGLTGEPLITFGAHTVHHPRLRNLDETSAETEIIGSKHEIEEIIGQKVNYFAYPFGGNLDINNRTKIIVKDAKFHAGFMVGDRLVRSSSKLISLPRINVRNMSGEELLDKLKKFRS